MLTCPNFKAEGSGPRLPNLGGPDTILSPTRPSASTHWRLPYSYERQIIGYPQNVVVFIPLTHKTFLPYTLPIRKRVLITWAMHPLRCLQWWIINATDEALKLGNPAFANVILLGALVGANVLPLDKESVEPVLREEFPTQVDANLVALSKGIELMEQGG